MSRSRIFGLSAMLLLAAAPVSLSGQEKASVATSAAVAQITGKYVEVRNCDVWTGPCFANAEGNLTGHNGAMVWQIEKGSFDNVALDGLTVIAVVQASDTLGCTQYGAAKAVIIVDSKATETQRKALIKFAQRQGGDLVANIVTVHNAKIEADMCCCDHSGCADIDAGIIKISTNCLHEEHKICGNEYAYYPPLTQGVDCVPAVANHSFTGTGLSSNWTESDRRGAYVGSFIGR